MNGRRGSPRMPLKGDVRYVGHRVGGGSDLLRSSEATEILAEIPGGPMAVPRQARATEKKLLSSHNKPWYDGFSNKNNCFSFADLVLRHPAH